MKKKHLKRIRNNSKVLRDMALKSENLERITKFISVYKRNLKEMLFIELNADRVGNKMIFTLTDGNFSAQEMVDLPFLIRSGAGVEKAIEKIIEENLYTITNEKSKRIDSFIGKKKIELEDFKVEYMQRWVGGDVD